MGTLVKWELKRFLKRKYIFVITTLLILLNLYIVNYEYDSYMNYSMYMENMGEELSFLQGEVTPPKRMLVEEEIKKIELAKENVRSESEGSRLVLKGFLYSDYINYIDNPLFPFKYEDKVFDNREELVDTLTTLEPNSKEYIELNGYLSITENVKNDRFFIMGWDYIFQQNFLMFLMVVIIISMTSVFGEDYTSGVASLTLSTKYGKSKLVHARVIAAVIFSTLILSSFFISEVAMKLWLHGINGYQGRLSQMGFIYLNNATPITQLVIFFLFTLLAAAVLSILTLGISLFTKKTLRAIVVMVLLNIVAEAVRITIINNFSIRILVNNFFSSFIEYNPKIIFGAVIHYPVVLVFWLFVVFVLSTFLVVYKGRQQYLT
ncbi:hypothetical protein HYG86_11805 [Alkalicella caledoniensis]|uniref:Uncharacterized protein n=1 Tax=Alkalicella caledoniensis TaxID=2731377 RepID=A0A7G9W9N7_ALKCA|nr:hypothetical protein [Alkalicella caledoniensis]QNO15399.1 hypothetical protein HYG86_11805 [Alkalicella caledoniensis]